ncbi:MAG: glycosyltransferase family 2 protein [Eubacteriales bacterium]|nr:glycosyltransferase family 2 protein [Eubacteriales bacterium]
MENKRCVSVITPAYRCAGTIRAAIDSALQQAEVLEILVINDCSPDSLDEVMQEYQTEERVRYLKNEKNLGAAGSRNRGMQQARGKYIAFLDADDWWEEGKLQKQLALLVFTGAKLSCTARELVTPEGELTGRVIPVSERISYRAILRHNQINCSSVVAEREAALEFPMCHEDAHEDYIMWMRFLKKYGYACGVNEPLLKYRLTATGKSGSKLHSAKMTYRSYRYAGFGRLRSGVYFLSYALHGVAKYAKSML